MKTMSNHLPPVIWHLWQLAWHAIFARYLQAISGLVFWHSKKFWNIGWTNAISYSKSTNSKYTTSSNGTIKSKPNKLPVGTGVVAGAIDKK